MAKSIATHYDFGKVGELRNALWHVLGTAPSAPGTGQFYYDSALTRFRGYNGSWKSLAHEDEVVKLTGDQTVAGIKTFSSFPVTPSSAPTTAYQVTNKQYVDDAVAAAVSGLDVKASVRVATTAAGTLASSFANGSTVDGVVLATGNRILIKDQAAGAENGIYTVNASGAPTRATDADVSAEVTAGMYTFVEEGTANADSGWILTTNSAITLGTTALVFVQFSGAGQITAGSGLTKTGNTLNVGAGTGITVNADDVAVNTSVVARKATGTIGNGSSTTLSFNHALANQWVTVQVIEVATLAQVDCDVVLTDANNVAMTFAVAPTTNAYRVIVVG